MDQKEDFIQLLQRFDKKIVLTDEEIATSYCYLFLGSESLPTTPRNRIRRKLHKTLFYLKDIMSRNDLQSLDEIKGYYHRKREDLNRFAEKLKARLQ